MTILYKMPKAKITNVMCPSDKCDKCNKYFKNMKKHKERCDKLCCMYCDTFQHDYNRLMKHEANCAVHSAKLLMKIKNKTLPAQPFNTPNAKINITDPNINNLNVYDLFETDNVINSIMEDEQTPQSPSLEQLETQLSQETESLKSAVIHNEEKNEEYKFDIIQNQLNNIVNLQKQMNNLLNSEINECKSETTPDIIESDIDICESDITIIEPDHTITELNDIYIELDDDIKKYINENEHIIILKYIYDNLDNFNNLYFHFEDKLDNSFNIGNDNIVDTNQKKEILWLKISYQGDNLFDVLEMTSLNNDFIDYKNMVKNVE